MPTTHDAATGFHDIKSLPDFAVPSHLTEVAGILAALALAYMVWRKVRSQTPSEKPEPSLRPSDIALAKVRELERQLLANTISPREYSTGLSTALRTYLESQFNFPATDCTSAEVVSLLKGTWKGTLPRMAQSRTDELLLKVSDSLRFCDRVTFADDTERHFGTAHDKLLEVLPQIRELIDTLADYIAREIAASATVSSQNSSLQNSNTQTPRQTNAL